MKDWVYGVIAALDVCGVRGQGFASFVRVAFAATAWLSFATCGFADVNEGTSEARPAYGGVLRIPFAGAEFQPCVYSDGNKSVLRKSEGAAKESPGGGRRFFIRTKAGADGYVDGTLRVAQTNTAVFASWKFSYGRKADVQRAFVRGVMPFDDYAGGRFCVDGVERDIPTSSPKGAVWQGTAKSLKLADVNGRDRLSLDFGGERSLSIGLDGIPKLGGRLVIKIFADACGEKRRVASLSFTASVPGGLRLGASGDYRIEPGPDWVPFRAEKGILPGSALDFSEMRGTGNRAGEFGRVVVVGEHLEFERRPGVPVRFMGASLSYGANCPDTPEDAREIAEVFARSGYNAARFHQSDYQLMVKDGPDDDWVNRDSTTPNPRRFRKFDRLVAELLDHGVYLSDSFLGHRCWTLKWRDCGIDRDGRIGLAQFKSLVQVHEGVYSNHMAYVRNFLSHRNEFTGRTYAEEPAMVFISIAGEGSLGADTALLEREEAWRTAWRKWLDAKKRESPSDYEGLPETFPKHVSERTRHAVAFKLFLADTEARFVQRTRKILREELGLKAPLSTQEGIFFTTHGIKSRYENDDVITQNFYVDHPQHLRADWGMPVAVGTESPVRNVYGAQTPAQARCFGKPFMVPEWNYCGPNPNRSVGGLLTGATAAFQDWAGVWRFDHFGSMKELHEPESAVIGAFLIPGDPIMRASERNTALLFLRGDMPVAKRRLAVTIPESVFSRPVDGAPDSGVWHYLKWTAWYGRVGTTVIPDGAELPNGTERLCSYPDDYYEKDFKALFRKVTGLDFIDRAHMPKAGDGLIEVNGDAGSFLLGTPRTCGAFLPNGGNAAAGAMQVRAVPGPVTVTVSSLDGKDIVTSSHLLVTHMVDCANAGATFSDASRGIFLDKGHPPQLVRKSKAELSLSVAEDGWTAWAIDMDGSRMKRVPVEFKDGRLTLVCDTACCESQAVFHYELER